MTGGKHITFGFFQKRFSRGFSIIELLVVVAVFSVAVLAISATYVNFTRLHRQVANAETLGEELRYISEVIVRAVRNNRISYAINPLPDQMQSFSLLDTANMHINFTHTAANQYPCGGLAVENGCLAMEVESEFPGPVALSGRYVDIEEFSVYITPVNDPFTPLTYGVYESDKQPIVTVFIKATYLAPNPRERATMTIQTSVASRVYVR